MNSDRISLWSVAVICLLSSVMNVSGFFTVRMAGISNTWTDPSDEVCGRNWGAAWYTNNCYDALRDGNVEGFAEFKINEIKQNSIGVPAFTTMATSEVPSENYFVYGVADEFQVPETKDYTFWVKANFSMFIKINGVLMEGGDPDDVWLINHGDDATRATKFGKWPLSRTEKASSEYGVKFEYPFTVRLETGKMHKLEFLYAHSTQLSHASFLVGETPETRDYVPVEWYGEKAVVGTPQGAFVSPGPTETVVEPSSRLELNFEVEVTYNPDDSKAPSFEWDFNGDGVVDETTQTNTTSYVYLNEGGTDQIFLPNVTIVVDTRRSLPIGGPTLFLGTGPVSLRYAKGGHEENAIKRNMMEFDPLGRSIRNIARIKSISLIRSE